MAVLWILGILLFLFLLLCLTRVGAQVSMSDGAVTVNVRFGRICFRVFPLPEKKKKPGKKKKAKEPEEAGEKPKKSLPKIGLEDIREGVAMLWPPLKRALNRTRRGIRIHPLDLRLTLGGGKDPAETVKLYAYLQSGVWSGMPLLEKLIQIPDPYIHIGMDFTASDTRVEGCFGVTIRIGTLLAVAFGVAIPALRWFLNVLKKGKKPVAQPAA